MNPDHCIRRLFEFLVVVACLLTGSPATAVAGTASAARPQPVIFTAFAWDPLSSGDVTTMNVVTAGKRRTLEIVWRDRSPPMECDGPGELVFTRTETREGHTLEVPVARASIPSGFRRALLVFGRNPSRSTDGLPYAVRVINDSLEIFPGQSVRFINYSRIELGGYVGGQSFAVRPGADQVVIAPLPEQNRLLPFRLARRDSTGEWKRLRSTGLPMTSGSRTLVFLIDAADRPGQPEMVFLRDTVPAEEPDTSK